MKITWIYSVIFSVLMTSALTAESWKIQSERAEQLFKQKAYDQAEVEYQALSAEYTGTWEFQFNLANTYYKNNKIGKALVSYKRALKLSPREKAILKNKAIAYAKVGGVRKEPSLKESLKAALDLVSVREIIVLGLGLWTLSLVLMGAYQKKSSEGLKNTMILGVGGIGIIFILLFLKIVLDSGMTEAIAIDKKGAVKSGPSQTFPTVGILKEGMSVWVEDDRSGWKKITTRTGITGWIEENKIECISQ